MTSNSFINKIIDDTRGIVAHGFIRIQSFSALIESAKKRNG